MNKYIYQRVGFAIMHFFTKFLQPGCKADMLDESRCD